MMRPTTRATRLPFPATEPMTTKLIASALFAGLLAGLIAVLLQFSFVESLILEAEQYESGQKVHFAGGAAPADQTQAATPASGETVAPAANTAIPAEEPGESIVVRFGLAFSNVFISYVGWALIMVAGFALAERWGHRITLEKGLLWGVAGFISVQLMPGIGLSPELPGIPAADLGARQLWWVATVISTALALAMFAYGRTAVFVVAGLALLAAPQIIGAPKLGYFSGIVPPELSAEFVSRTLAEAMAAWIVLGLAASYLWARKTRTT
jgi:cobalt transporter subunit CbtA